MTTCILCYRVCFTGGALVFNPKTKTMSSKICKDCNKGLAYFKDNIDILKKAIKYLEEFKRGN